MKIQLTPLAVSLALMGVLATPIVANASTNDEKLANLEAQLNQIQHEVTTLKKTSQTGQGSSKSLHQKHNTSAKKTNQPMSLAAEEKDVQTPDTNQIQGPTDLPQAGAQYLPVDLDVPGQSFVSSGPYIGIPLEYSGANLIINSPNVNEDIALLNIRKNIAQRLSALGRTGDSSGSHILLSGIIEGQALDRAGSGSTNTSDIDLTTANLDAYILGPTSWTSGLLELAYDNNIGTETGSFSSNDRTLNSRVFVNKAFVVLGNFQQSPFYTSFGQMFVPFGVYSTTMISSSLPKILSRIQARAITVGYKQQAENSLNLSAYIFHGATEIDGSSNINNGGLNAAYSFKMMQVNASVGGGVVANIADSQGMQFTGNNNNTPPLFGGFGGPVETYTNSVGVVTQASTGNEEIAHRVPAYDVHANIGIGDNIQLLGEYVISSTSFSASDLTFNGSGARPQALQLEGVYNLAWFVKPTSISLGYGMSKEALAIGLPAQRYSFAVNRSFWKNTLQTLELRHDINYAEWNTATGSEVPNLMTGTSTSSNMVTLQFDYYF
jgi:hypothetical protein